LKAFRSNPWLRRLAAWWPCALALALRSATPVPAGIDLSHATVVVRAGKLPPAEETAARVLVEEIGKRTGLHWHVATEWPKTGAAIGLSSGGVAPGWPVPPVPGSGVDPAASKTEGFRFVANGGAIGRPAAWILGADPRGVLFGVGEFLRSVRWDKGTAVLPAELDRASSPALPIRGHQLGYRQTANSYDGWDERQFEQYIRELALFGANSIEAIPFQDSRKSPHMPIPRDTMNRRLSAICARYDLDYWLWSPADFDLNDAAKRAGMLSQHEALFRDCPRVDAVFFPGGDPGDNPPEIVVEFLGEMSRILLRYHPRAKIWFSMQGFRKAQVDFVHGWIDRNQPDWLGGLVAGPSSPGIPETRARLPRRYGLRDYPDITHTVRCQFPVPWWDPAFHLTLGREPANPRPAYYKAVQDYFGPYTSGFISYSDGIHDDVNKAVWSRLGWQPDASPREIVLDYTRCFFGASASGAAADGILALEKNWEGPLAGNGGVEATLALWESLERSHPELRGNWRWQLCLLRANYDAYVRQRLVHETESERRANDLLATARVRGADGAMDAALGVLRAELRDPVAMHRRARVGELCADLFRSIRLQSSVPLYQASGYERGAVLDFVDHPLNNRWWLEDQFAAIRAGKSEAGKVAALDTLRTWENPGAGSYYDEVGNIAKSPRVMRGEGVNTDPAMERNPNPGYWWWDDGACRKRLSLQTSMDWPLALKYARLDPRANYRVRVSGHGHPRPRANGRALVPATPGKLEVGGFLEFPVPPGSIPDGNLVLTFDALPDEAELNWRQQSRISEVWLLRD
jgi:hypothetical protein